VSQAVPWNNEESIREELFSIERLEQHAESLAAAQPVTARTMTGRSLAGRLKNNESVLLQAYRAIAAAVGQGRVITPAAEWLLDNYHLVQEQIREIRNDLPPGYYRQLPKLAAGPLAGYPRVFGVAWAFVAHTDSRFDTEMLRRFVRRSRPENSGRSRSRFESCSSRTSGAGQGASWRAGPRARKRIPWPTGSPA
jgi:cyclic beta-1,2-glucan synthetase